MLPQCMVVYMWFQLLDSFFINIGLFLQVPLYNPADDKYNIRQTTLWTNRFLFNQPPGQKIDYLSKIMKYSTGSEDKT